MAGDPVHTDPGLYRVVFENERVRVLDYRDEPGESTSPHWHPDSVMCTLSSFRRRISHGAQQVELELAAGEVRWLDAQEHAGQNIGDTPTHTIFVELKEQPAAPASGGRLGPVDA